GGDGERAAAAVAHDFEPTFWRALAEDAIASVGQAVERQPAGDQQQDCEQQHARDLCTPPGLEEAIDGHQQAPDEEADDSEEIEAPATIVGLCLAGPRQMPDREEIERSEKGADQGCAVSGSEASETPASVNVAISARILAAASMMNMASAAPVPSPRRMSSERRGS